MDNPEEKSRKGIGGPKTEEGKRKSSMNALKHGLTAKATESRALIEECDQEYYQVYEQVASHYMPADPVEEQLVRRIAVCLWRLNQSIATERRRRKQYLGLYRTDSHLQSIVSYERLVDIHLHRAIKALRRKREAPK
jgi:hypothetical protein